MAFAKSMIHILEWMCFELLCTNILVVGKIGKVLLVLSYTFYKWEIRLFAVMATISLYCVLGLPWMSLKPQ